MEKLKANFRWTLMGFWMITVSWGYIIPTNKLSAIWFLAATVFMSVIFMVSAALLEKILDMAIERARLEMMKGHID